MTRGQNRKEKRPSKSKPLPQKQHGLWKRLNNTYGTIASILTIIGAVIGAIFYIAEQYDIWKTTRDQQYSGIWTNPTEGCVGCEFDNDETRPIILDLRVSNGAISGVLNASGWLDALEETKINNDLSKRQNFREFKKVLFQYLNVTGQLGFYGGKIEIFNIVGGKLHSLGKGKIYMDGALRLKMEEPHFIGIPNNAELYRSEEDGVPCKTIDPKNPSLCLTK